MYADMICNNNYQVCTLFVLGVLVHLQAGLAHYAASYASDEAYFEAHYAAIMPQMRHTLRRTMLQAMPQMRYTLRRTLHNSDSASNVPNSMPH